MGETPDRGPTLWLVGMMGAGKSAVGRALAARLGRRLLDTDAEIEAGTGRSVATIFAEEGEARFRELEREVVEAAAGHPWVVALGGGAPAQPGLARRLAASGVVVYLRARPETLVARLGEARDRPLLAGRDAAAREARVRELLESRRRYYEKADVTVDTDGIDVETVAVRVAEHLPRGGAPGEARR